MVACENMYQLPMPKTYVMSIESLSKSACSLPKCNDRPRVKAATVLNQNSSTEIIDVSKLSQKNSSIIQYVEIADVSGRLYSINQINSSCWLKIVTIAKDCQSCNVLLMMTDTGVVLKTIKSITPGEPLAMWFTENILAMLNMPYLTDLNIKGKNRYICHLCNNHFESPNPLKIHLALKCNRLDSNYLWTQLAREFLTTQYSPLSGGLSPKFPAFSFELTALPRTSPISIPPALLVEPSSTTSSFCRSQSEAGSYAQQSPSPSTQPSPPSSNQASPPSPGFLSYYSTSPTSTAQSASPVKRHSSNPHHSAFTPYINKRKQPVVSRAQPSESPLLAASSVYPPAPEFFSAPSDAAQVETFFSNHAKVSNGHQCFYCGKVYSRKYGLKIHIRTHTGFKPLQCKFCARPFGDPSNLNKHVRLHSEGETPYKCDLCQKVLVRKRDLERHMRSRHQDNADPSSDNSTDGVDN